MIAARTFRLLLPWTLGAAALAVVYGRFIVQARGAVHAARVAAGNGDAAEATRLYLDALRAYVPGSPFERQALDGLHALAADAAGAGDRDGERRALGAVRAGLLGTRSLYVPYGSRLADANRRLGELDATEDFPPANSGRIVIERSAPPGPAIAATLLALVGFAAWIGGLLLFIRRGVDRTPTPAVRPVGSAASAGSRLRPSSHPPSPPLLPPLLFVVGFALFLIGLRLT